MFSFAAASPDILIFVAVFAVLAIAVLASPTPRRQVRAWQDARRTRPGPYHQPSAPHLVPSHTSDPVDQLRAVMNGAFTAKTVLSRTEANVMAAAEAAIAEAGLRWRVLAQVALGEVLSSPDEAAFRAINAKRVDLLIVSERRLPLAAIEYQGEGHWQGQAPARDAVKKEALRRAGVRYIEITPEHGPADIRGEIARLAVAACRNEEPPRKLARRGG